ncbi:MAG: CinA family protein [Alphaproteobacteria bacterium]
MIDDHLLEASEALLAQCRAMGLKIATAESCTGGLLSAALTAIPGSSDIFERGFATYSNEAKAECLGVPLALIAAHGAVSAEVARAMADGALARSAAQLSVAVTGVAGPGGGGEAKPVGLVFIAVARRGAMIDVERHVFAGDRAAIRESSVAAALALLSRQAS